MNDTSREEPFQIDEDHVFQNKEWKIQRIAWVILYLLLAAIMLGVLGKGALSEARIGTSDGPVQLEYQRFMRYGAPDDLRFTLRTSSEMVRLELDKNYFDQAELTAVVPQPERMLATSRSISFIFPAQPGQHIQITLSIKPKKAGKQESWFSVDGQARQSFRQFIYP